MVQSLRFQGVRDTGSACIRFTDSDSGHVVVFPNTEHFRASLDGQLRDATG